MASLNCNKFYNMAMNCNKFYNMAMNCNKFYNMAVVLIIDPVYLLNIGWSLL